MSGDRIVDDARRDITRRLAAAGIEDAAVEARLLIQHAPGAAERRHDVLGETPISREAEQWLHAALSRRLSGAPLAHIVGSRGFWTLDLAVSPDVLIPRHETEHVVEALLAVEAPPSARVLDLGTGSGAILLSVLSERSQAFGVGVDMSQAAIAVARANARAAGLGGRCAFAVGDWNAAIAGAFDLIACNPPYIPSEDIEGLQPEVRDHEPRAALDGGPDGLAAYRVLAPALTGLLSPGGVAAFEVGAGQAAAVKELFIHVGLTVHIRRDLAGHERVLEVRRRSEFPH